jgi:hypothetical protein
MYTKCLLPVLQAACRDPQINVKVIALTACLGSGDLLGVDLCQSLFFLVMICDLRNYVHFVPEAPG